MSNMSNRSLLTNLIVVAVAMGGQLVWAQKSPQTAWDLKPTTVASRTSQVTDPVLERIQNIETKMVAAAEDFPEDLYNTYRPKGNQDVRTAAEILLHVAALNTRQAFNLNTKKQKDALFAAGKVPTFPLNFPYVSLPVPLAVLFGPALNEPVPERLTVLSSGAVATSGPSIGGTPKRNR